MPSVKVRENEPFEFALRRFKRTCEKAGVLAETRKREFYEKPTQERKRKAAAAVKRQLRRSSRDVTSVSACTDRTHLHCGGPACRDGAEAGTRERRRLLRFRVRAAAPPHLPPRGSS